MPGLAWLTARPIAHRGLHDAARGIIENTSSAVAAAVAAGYGVEVDLQITADGKAMVHHDDALGRLTDGQGRLAAMTAAQLQRVPFKATSDRMLTLEDLLDLVGGRATLVLELKSRFDGDHRLVARAAAVLAGYGGPAAVMSFDPALIVAMRESAGNVPRGIVAECHYEGPEWGEVSTTQKLILAHLLHGWRTQPHFVAYHVKDLPCGAPVVARYVFGLPLLTWTVRTADDQRCAKRWADQMIFEGFRA
jgi:glycerophosphoryl diester phosphodiesterase